LQEHSKPRQKQRQRIGRVVTRIGYQRETMRAQAEDEFDNDECRGGQ
jgi:hypothetical protein